MTKFLHIIHWMKLVQNIQFHKMSLLQILESAASNDQISDGMECTAASMKRGVHEDSSDDDIYANPIKKSASSSPAGKRSGTHVSRERGREDLAKISSFPSAPRSGEQRAKRGSLSPIRPPSFTSGGSSRRTNNQEKILIIKPLILWQERWNKEVGNKLHAKSCPKLVTSITRNAQTEKMKLLLIIFK